MGQMLIPINNHPRYNKDATKYSFSLDNKVCNICGLKAEEVKLKRLVRDHNHKTGFIRGALCDTCNSRLGIYESEKNDSKFILKSRRKKKFINWLKKYENNIIQHLTQNTGILYSKKYY